MESMFYNILLYKIVMNEDDIESDQTKKQPILNLNSSLLEDSQKSASVSDFDDEENNS